MADPLIAVPDDYPSVFEGTPAHARAKTIGETKVVTARGAEEEAELIRRIDRAKIAINIRATTLRIGTMGITSSPLYVLPTLSALELALRDLGYKCAVGASVAAAQAAFADAS